MVGVTVGQGTVLVTGEAVPIDLRVARTGSRLVAAVIDLALQLAVYLVVVFAVLTHLAGGDADLLAALALSAYVLAFLVYPVACETLWRGRTPGKAALGLRAVRHDGGPLRFRHAFVRGLIGFVLERPGITLGTAAVITSMIDASGRRLGDIFAGTVVLQERVPAPPPLRVAMPPPLAAWASTLDISAIPGPLLLAARQYLARGPQLTPEARERLGADLANQVARLVTPPPPMGTPAWAYLMAVLAEQRRRDAPPPPAEPSGGPPATGGRDPSSAGPWGPPDAGPRGSAARDAAGTPPPSPAPAAALEQLTAPGPAPASEPAPPGPFAPPG
jgi:uncharacterized RDD family membrane protein YckC